MSQVITNAFASYWQACLTDEAPVVLDAFVLANIPGLDPDGEISPDDGLPPAAHIVYRQAVDQRGRINLDAVAYTIVMDTSVGDFEFNAMYLINTEANLVGMIVHKGLEAKLKTVEASGQTGNSLVKSMLMEYDRASLATVTTVDAGTWQIDYAARLAGMDEDMRRLALPLYGPAWFEGDGFGVTNNAGVYHVRPGVAVVGGLLVVLTDDQIVTPAALPIEIWADVHRAGSVTGAWQNHVSLVLGTEDLTDYIDDGGYQHHVAQLAIITADSNVTDTRRQRTHNHHWDEVTDKPTLEQMGGYPMTGGPLDGGVDAKDAIYARTGVVARSRAGSNGGTWLGMEAPENADPYISAKVNTENAPSKVITIGRNEITAHKRLAADYVRVGANGGLKFSPYEDFRGRSWGAGMDPANGMWGLHRYQDEAWQGQALGVSSDGAVQMNSLVVAGGSESQYHQIRNSGNPSLELHQPGHSAVMMYKPNNTGRLRIARSNGAGGEAEGYAQFESQIMTVFGRIAAEWSNARAWQSWGANSLWTGKREAGEGALYGLVGGQYHFTGSYEVEMYNGHQTHGNLDNCAHTFACQGEGYLKVWSMRNGGTFESPSGWYIKPNGDLWSPRLNTTVVDWCMSSFALKQAASGNADVVAGSYHAIGAYVFAALIPAGGKTSHGQRAAGAYLRPCSASEWGYAGYSLPGTWQCMGDIMGANDDERYDDRATLWIRVA